MKINLYDYGLMGKRLQQTRKARKYTQATLAEKMKMSPKNLSSIERGATGISISTLISICEILNISADYILFGNKNGNQNNAVNIILSELNEREQIHAEKLLSVYVEACKDIIK